MVIKPKSQRLEGFLLLESEIMFGPNDFKRLVLYVTPVCGHSVSHSGYPSFRPSARLFLAFLQDDTKDRPNTLHACRGQ